MNALYNINNIGGEFHTHQKIKSKSSQESAQYGTEQREIFIMVHVYCIIYIPSGIRLKRKEWWNHQCCRRKERHHTKTITHETVTHEDVIYVFQILLLERNEI
jgi:hypothetical protein